MLGLTVNGSKEPELFHDQLVTVKLVYENSEQAKVKALVSLSGLAADNAVTTHVLHEQEIEMAPNSSHEFELHISTANHNLSNMIIGFDAVATVARKQLGKPRVMEDFATVSEPLFDGFEQEPADKTIQTEVARASIKCQLVACIEMSIHYVRPSLDKDHALCQFDLAALDSDIVLKNIKFKLPQGQATLVGEAGLPLSIDAKGMHAFTYLLESLLGSTRVIKLTLEYECHGQQILTEWSTQVNFAEAQGPLPKTPTMSQATGGGLSRNSVPSVASFSSQAAIYPSTTNLSARGGSLSGININLEGPSQVEVGTEFEWKISVINKSNRARKLVIRFFGRDQAPVALARHEERALVSDPFTLRKRIQAYRTAIGSPLGIIPLVSDLRIGQLGAYACFETSVKLLAAETGFHSVSGSSVTDVNTGETFDTSELLQVLVTESLKGSPAGSPHGSPPTTQPVEAPSPGLTST